MITIIVNGVEKVYTEEEYQQLLKDNDKRIVEDAAGKKKLLEKLEG